MKIRPRTRRVLIALDPAAPTSATLDALAGLVGAERPEICGLFIEDVTLLGLSSLSVVREVALDTGVEDVMDTARLERQMHAQRVRVERMLTGAMSRFSVQPEFKVTRGRVRDELRREAQSADLVVVGRSPRQAGARCWMGIRLGSLAAEINGILAFVQDAWLTGKSVALVYDGTECASRCLALAQRIAANENLPMVAVLVGNPRDCSRWQAALGSDSAAPRVRQWHGLETPRLGDLPDVVRAANARVIVLPGHLEKQRPELIESLLRQLECSIVAVGEGPETAATAHRR